MQIKDDALKSINELMRKDTQLRAKLKTYLQSEVHPDLSGIQFLHSDSDGRYVKPPEGGWPSDDAAFKKALGEEKNKVYQKILAHYEAGGFKAQPVGKVEPPAKPNKKAAKAKVEVEQDDLVDPFDDFDEEELTPPPEPKKPEPEPTPGPPVSEGTTIQEPREDCMETCNGEPCPNGFECDFGEEDNAPVKVANDKVALLEALLSDSGITEERVIELIEERLESRLAKIRKALT